jgi:hypothetical protein
MEDNDLVLAMLGLACAGVMLVVGLFLIMKEDRGPDIIRPIPMVTSTLVPSLKAPASRSGAYSDKLV